MFALSKNVRSTRKKFPFQLFGHVYKKCSPFQNCSQLKEICSEFKKDARCGKQSAFRTQAAWLGRPILRVRHIRRLKIAKKEKGYWNRTRDFLLLSAMS